MAYNIRALSLVDHEALAKSLVAAGVSVDVDRAKMTIRSWRTKRGWVSTNGERVIRSMVEPEGIALKVDDFWDPEVKKATPEKLMVPA